MLKYFLNLGGFTGKIAKVIEFSPSDFTLSYDFDVGNLGGMKGESSFYAYTVGYSSYGESFSDTAVSFGDYNAFESLYSFFGTFDNLERNLNGVADVERRLFKFSFSICSIIFMT